jgi:hypothetical protein
VSLHFDIDGKAGLTKDHSNQLHTGLPNWKTEIILRQHFGIEIGDSSVIWSLAAFGFGSLIGTLPTVLAFRKIGPALTLAIILFSWGFTMVITSVVRHFHSFVFARLCLGLFQSGFLRRLISVMFPVFLFILFHTILERSVRPESLTLFRLLRYHNLSLSFCPTM